MNPRESASGSQLALNAESGDAGMLATWTRRTIVPLLVTLALLMALLQLGLSDRDWLYQIHGVCVAAWLLSSWSRPRTASPRRLSDIVVFGFCVLGIGWALANLARSEVPAVAEARVWLLVDAVLLLLSSRGTAIVAARSLLALLVGGQLVVLVLTGAVWHFDTLPPRWLMAGFLAVFGLLVMLLTIGRDMSSRRFRLSTLLLVFLLGALLFGRWWLRESKLDEPSSLSELPYQHLVAGLARQELRQHPLTGIGFGGFERRLSGYDVELSGAALTPALRAGSPPTRAKSLSPSPYSAVVRGEPETGAVAAIQLYLVECGVIGLGLGLLLALYIAMHAVYEVRRSPHGNDCVFGIGLLLLWGGIAVEGALSLALHEPFGLLLFAVLAGCAWGVLSRMRESRYSLQPQSAGRLDVRESENAQVGQRHSTTRSGWRGLLSLVPRGAGLRAWVPRPARWVSLLSSAIVAAGLLVVPYRQVRARQITARIFPTGLATEETGTLLRRAQVLYPWNPETYLLQASHFRHRLQAEGYQEPLVDEAIKAYRRAILYDPYLDRAYEAWVDFCRILKRPEGMQTVLAKWRRHCPRSLLLPMWEARYAETIGDSFQLERALEEAARRAGDYYPPLRDRLLARRAGLYLSRGDRLRALETYYTRFAWAPANLPSLVPILDLSVSGTPEPSHAPED